MLSEQKNYVFTSGKKWLLQQTLLSALTDIKNILGLHQDTPCSGSVCIVIYWSDIILPTVNQRSRLVYSVVLHTVHIPHVYKSSTLMVTSQRSYDKVKVVN